MFLVDDAALDAGVGFDQFGEDIFVEHLGLGVHQLRYTKKTINLRPPFLSIESETYSNVDGALIDGLDDQATLDGTTRGLGAQTEHSGGDEALVVVFVGATTPPD